MRRKPKRNSLVYRRIPRFRLARIGEEEYVLCRLRPLFGLFSSQLADARQNPGIGSIRPRRRYCRQRARPVNAVLVVADDISTGGGRTRRHAHPGVPIPPGQLAYLPITRAELARRSFGTVSATRPIRPGVVVEWLAAVSTRWSHDAARRAVFTQRARRRVADGKAEIARASTAATRPGSSTSMREGHGRPLSVAGVGSRRSSCVSRRLR